jgi:hypothetical protein
MTDMFKSRLWKLRHRILAWAKVVDEWRAGNPARLIMVTLTYADIEGWESGHIRSYMKAMKQKIGDKLLGWAWVCEMQKRRAMHYHILFLVEKGTRFPMPDKSGFWEHGLSQTATARTAFYLVKYVGKEYQKDLTKFPKGCRLYATSIRFGGERERILYQVYSGMLDEKRMTEFRYFNKGQWEFVGTAVTEGYAKSVLANNKLGAST